MNKASDKKTKITYLMSLKHLRFVEVVLIVFFIGFVFHYLIYTYNRYEDNAKDEAIILAQSLESLIHYDHIAALSGSLNDLDDPEYHLAKTGLTRLVETTNDIHFAYIIKQIDNKMIIVMDSEMVDSENYSPPGDVYYEADDAYQRVFLTKETTITKPITDRWGTWISVLVPIIDSQDNTVVAVFAIDYDAKQWNNNIWQNMTPDFFIIVILTVLLVVIISIKRQHDIVVGLSEKLKYDEALYRSVFDQAPLGISIVNDKNFVFDADTLNMSINPKFEQILGRSRIELSEIKWTDITHPDDLEEDLYQFARFKNGEIDGYSMEKRFIRPNGEYVWTNMHISHFIELADNEPMHLCLLEDISERKNAEISLIESERNKSVLLSHLPGMAYRCAYDRKWTMHYVSSGCYDLTGYYSDSLINNKVVAYNDLIAQQYREILWDKWQEVLPKRLPFQCEYEIITANGTSKWVLELAEGVYNEKGEVEALEGIVIDISDRKRLEDVLVYNNEHDRWTGLFNLYYLENALIIDRNKQSTDKRALIGLSFGSIQAVATTYGYHYTQELMKKIAEILNRFTNDNYQLFSTYWDRFVFYVKYYQDQDELNVFSATLKNALNTLLKSERLTGGIGILEITNERKEDPDLLLRKLLIATERALISDGFELGVCYYDEAMAQDIMREETIIKQLRHIAYDDIESGLLIKYQPILELKTDKIVGFEALARLDSPEYGMISPLEFIPILEKTRDIIPVGEKIIDKALSFYKKMANAGYADVSISINISIIQLLSTNFTEILINKIKTMSIDYNNITLELTESMFSKEYDEINRVIDALRNYGIQIAIDDFGTGYSSLAKQRELSVDCLKIGRYFIDKLSTIELSKTITSDIVSIAHKLGNYAVAEGVETTEQKAYLIACECDMIQGYLVSKPLDEDDALSMLIKSKE